MTTQPIPPIAVESAKEHLIALLTDCTYARFAELGGANAVDLVRSHALNVLDALTPDEEHPPCPDGGYPDPVTGAYCPDCLENPPTPDPPAPSLEILHRAAGCRCSVVPALSPTPAICRECSEGKCGNCDTTAWDDTLDAPTACSCTHPGVRS